MKGGGGYLMGEKRERDERERNGRENVRRGAGPLSERLGDFTLKSNQGQQKVSAKVRGASSIL